MHVMYGGKFHTAIQYDYLVFTVSLGRVYHTEMRGRARAEKYFMNKRDH